MGHPPHPRVTPSGKGGSWRPRRGGKPSSERRSAAGVRLINLGPSQSPPRTRPPPPAPPPPRPTAHGRPRRLEAGSGNSWRLHAVAEVAAAAGRRLPTPRGRRKTIPPRTGPSLAGGLSAAGVGSRSRQAWGATPGVNAEPTPDKGIKLRGRSSIAGITPPPPINSTNCRQVPERFKLSAFNCSSPGTLFTNTGLLLGNVLVPGIPFLTLLPTEMVAVAWGEAFSEWSASLSDGAW